ncbi:glycoside hydrolase family 38 C-terminal domain-containing protein [Chitinophaga sp.]|uniref:glycoside hydrolase family 38 N-terminal domain-containing protein n=1 Tax=Chitinophaga sp. TaxID=1869181 RepID=UPI0031DEE92E
MYTRFLLLATLACSTLHAQRKTYTSVAVKPTVAYLNYHGHAARMARLEFHEGKCYEGGNVYIQFNQKRDTIHIAPDTAGISVFELPLPGDEITRETQLYVALGDYHASCIVAPAKQWKVYILPHSHVDVGYTDVQEKVLRIHMNNIDEAIKIAERTQNYPAEARFKWNTEAIWVVDHYLSAASETQRNRFWNAVKKGWINLDAAYGNVNTSATSSMQLMHMFSKGIKLAHEQGIDIHTLFQGDVPGASWGLAAQTAVTGIRYFLGAPNAGDRIGNSYLWRDRPFYWVSPSGKEKLLFWQCAPYSIGYTLKGSKIPNFFTVEDPVPFYTGHPSDNFLNPYLFEYLDKLKGFPYNMTLLTWAMSDNAPIDPELPDAVKAWNERYASPKLIITSTAQFFHDVEAAYKNQLPEISGDYTEYWTDGIGSGAKEAALTRNAADRLQTATAISTIRGKQIETDNVWTDLVMFNEHTWGAWNSISAPADQKVISEWNYKQAFALRADSASKALLQQSTHDENILQNAIDVYNTLSVTRDGWVRVTAVGDLVKDASGNAVPSQRLSNGELAFLVKNQAPFSKQRFTIQRGKPASGKELATVENNIIKNGIYTIELDATTGNIIRLEKENIQNFNLADSTGLNIYTFNDSLAAGPAHITIKEKGPLVASLLVTNNYLTREIRLVAGLDKVEIINTIDKQPATGIESIRFLFPFKLDQPQVRYNIPWGSITAEADQLPHANRNWYTIQRWIDVSNHQTGITLCSPDAPLFEIGKHNKDGDWKSYTEQSSYIASWVMNNIWHTNFRKEQPGVATFRYALQVHGKYDPYTTNIAGLEESQPLIAAPASGAAKEQLFFRIKTGNVYVENINPSADGRGVIMQLVNAADKPDQVEITSGSIWQTNVLEENLQKLQNTFTIPAKGVMMVKIIK